MTPTEQDKELRESISQIQFDCWSDKGSHQPEKSSCQECNNQLTQLVEQEIVKARIDELEDLSPGMYYFGDIVKIDNRIAELKAQQEEV